MSVLAIGHKVAASGANRTGPDVLKRWIVLSTAVDHYAMVSYELGWMLGFEIYHGIILVVDMLSS